MTGYISPDRAPEAIASRALASRYGLQPGDHLVVWHKIYSHHGIYLGEGRVAHYKGLSKGLLVRQQDTSLRAELLTHFAGARRIQVQRHKSAPFTRSQVVSRACSRLGEDNYRILFNNCEHFCRWCWLDKKVSRQVRVGIAVTGLLTAGGIALVGGQRMQR